MNAVALWGDHVGVGAKDIYVNYNVDWEENRHFWLWNTALVFLSFCGVALMVQLGAAFLQQNGTTLKVFLPTWHPTPTATPVGHLWIPRKWGEPPVSGGGDYSEGSRQERRSCGKTQSKSGPSSGYLHRVTGSSSRLWAGWKYLRGNGFH